MALIRVNDKWVDVKGLVVDNCYSMDVWHKCLQSFRKFLRRWDLKNKGAEKMAKQAFSKKIEEIDLVAEKRLLTMEEWEQRIDLENKLDKMSRLEDLQWKQKAGKN
jgi:hypothetical protein